MPDFAGWYRLRGLGRVGLLRLVDLSTEAGSSVRLTRARGSPCSQKARARRGVVVPGVGGRGFFCRRLRIFKC